MPIATDSFGVISSCHEDSISFFHPHLPVNVVVQAECCVPVALYFIPSLSHRPSHNFVACFRSFFAYVDTPGLMPFTPYVFEE